MSIEYYAGQSIVDTPKKKDGSPTRRAATQKSDSTKKRSQGRQERIALVDGKLAVVKK